jgi:hypothetical protein
MSPVVLDPVHEAETKGEKDLAMGVELALTAAQKSAVVMTKYTSTDPLRADFQPDKLWYEQIVADTALPGARRARIQGLGISGEPEALNVDHGIYIDLHGTNSSQVGILPGRPPMSEDEVDAYMDSNPAENIPMFNKWEFRIHKAFKTDGPQGRIDLVRSEDQKRKASQTEMYDSFTGMFQKMMSVMAAGQDAQNLSGNISPEAQQVWEAGQKVLQESGSSFYDKALPSATDTAEPEVVSVTDSGDPKSPEDSKKIGGSLPRR